MTSKTSVTYQSCRSAGVFLFKQDFLVFNTMTDSIPHAQRRQRGPGLRKLSMIIRVLTVFSTDAPSKIVFRTMELHKYDFQIANNFTKATPVKSTISLSVVSLYTQTI